VINGKIAMWLDDIRLPPDGWTWVKTAREAKELLAKGVEWASLDHDLGDVCDRCWDLEYEAGTEIIDSRRRTAECGGNDCACGCHEDGSSLVRWMAETNTWPVTKPRVHSANPVGAAYMRGVIERYWSPK